MSRLKAKPSALVERGIMTREEALAIDGGLHMLASAEAKADQLAADLAVERSAHSRTQDQLAEAKRQTLALRQMANHHAASADRAARQLAMSRHAILEEAAQTVEAFEADPCPVHVNAAEAIRAMKGGAE